MSAEPLISLRGIGKRFGSHQALRGIDLDVAPGSVLVLIGPSGSGKSTLLNLIGLLDNPTEGELYLLGEATRQPRLGQGQPTLEQHHQQHEAYAGAVGTDCLAYVRSQDLRGRNGLTARAFASAMLAFSRFHLRSPHAPPP